MPKCRIVQGGVVRLPLSDGDWIDVKEELNAGEYVDQLRDMADRKSFVKILAYVVAWSFVNVDGTALAWDLDAPIEVRRSTIASLTKGTARELVVAIDKHEAAYEAVLAKKKPDPSSSPASKETSTSAAP